MGWFARMIIHAELQMYVYRSGPNKMPGIVVVTASLNLLSSWDVVVIVVVKLPYVK